MSAPDWAHRAGCWGPLLRYLKMMIMIPERFVTCTLSGRVVRRARLQRTQTQSRRGSAAEGSVGHRRCWGGCPCPSFNFLMLFCVCEGMLSAPYCQHRFCHHAPVRFLCRDSLSCCGALFCCHAPALSCPGAVPRQCTSTEAPHDALRCDVCDTRCCAACVNPTGTQDNHRADPLTCAPS